MAKRSYGQFCGLALALDRVGDRWTLLIVRELTAGPARFGELHEGLPGIATNLLTDRLRALEESGLIARRPSEEAHASLYELTEAGQQLAPAMRELMLWGMRFMPETAPCAPANARSWVAGLTAMSSEVPVGDLEASLLLLLDDHELSVVIDGKSAEYALGPPPSIDATVALDHTVMIAMARGELEPREAIDHSSVSVEGDRAAAEVFFELLGRIRDAQMAGASA